MTSSDTYYNYNIGPTGTPTYNKLTFQNKGL